MQSRHVKVSKFQPKYIYVNKFAITRQSFKRLEYMTEDINQAYLYECDTRWRKEELRQQCDSSLIWFSRSRSSLIQSFNRDNRKSIKGFDRLKNKPNHETPGQYKHAFLYVQGNCVLRKIKPSILAKHYTCTYITDIEQPCNFMKFY